MLDSFDARICLYFLKVGELHCFDNPIPLSEMFWPEVLTSSHNQLRELLFINTLQYGILPEQTTWNRIQIKASSETYYCVFKKSALHIHPLKLSASHADSGIVQLLHLW
jgi:hypothetical protein